jgi:hypothetical protein
MQGSATTEETQMLLALAVLLIQPSALPVKLPTNAKLQQAAGQSMTQSTPAPVTPTNSVQKTAPAPASAPASDPVFPAMSQQDAQGSEASFAPGQFELTRLNATKDESSSRSVTAPASYAPRPYTPTREAGRMHGTPRKWLILSGIAHGAATFDAYSTRRVISNGTGVELNPMLRPFANSNALYGAVQVAPAIFDFVGLRMMHSQHAWMRRLWWVPQSASAAASMFGGVHNSMMH